MMWIDLAVIGAWIAPAFTPASALAIERAFVPLFISLIFFRMTIEQIFHGVGSPKAGR